MGNLLHRGTVNMKNMQIRKYTVSTLNSGDYLNIVDLKTLIVK